AGRDGRRRTARAAAPGRAVGALPAVRVRAVAAAPAKSPSAVAGTRRGTRRGLAVGQSRRARARAGRRTGGAPRASRDRAFAFHRAADLRTRHARQARASAARRAARRLGAALGLRPFVGRVPLRRRHRLVQLAAAPPQGRECRAAGLVGFHTATQLQGMSRMLDKARALLQKAKRRSWMKYALRGVSANDNFERLDLAYSIEDPWNMDSPAEQTRF